MTQTAVKFEDGTTLTERIADWTQTYADTLTENYKQYHVRSMESMSSDWSQKQLEDVKNGTANLMRFVIKSGRKYYKIMQQDFDTFQDRNEYREGSVHAFVDKKTGEVYKPASYNAPAKHVRYDLRIIKDRENLHNPMFTGWAGGYLYMR